MTQTLQGALQAAIRSALGCANDFNGDLHAMCDVYGIPAAPISGRLIPAANRFDASITDASSALNYFLQNPQNACGTLALDFTRTSTLDPRITFSRGSQATLFDSTGALVYAKHNLVVQSQTFQTTWTVANAVISADVGTAPDGTSTADLLYPLTTGTFRIVFQGGATADIPWTISVYAKASGMTWLALGTNTNTADCAWFNLATGAVGTKGANITSHSISAMGNGWYRCIVTFTASVARSLMIAVVDGDNTSTATASGTNGILIWGGQLNATAMEGGVTSSLSTYYPTVASAYYAPRFDYNPSTFAAQGLLIEEQRTNFMLRSEEFSDASWTKGGATVTADSTTAPSGTTTADTLVEDTSTGQHRVYRTTSGTTNTNPYTISFFAKASTRTRVYVGLAEGTTFVRQGNAVFDLSAGTIVSFTPGGGGATGGSATIQNVGNGWYRCAYTLTLGGTDTSIFNDINLVSTGTTISYTGNGTSGLFIWGAQLEVGAFATSYIPTTTTALTRNADVASMTGTNFSSWYNAAAGSLYTEFVINSTAPTSGFPTGTSLNNGTLNNRINAAYLNDSVNLLDMFVSDGGVTQAALSSGTYTAMTVAKMISVYASNDFALCTNGGSVFTDTSGTVPTVSRLEIGNQISSNYLNGYIRRISYYNYRVSNAQLQALTGS